MAINFNTDPYYDDYSEDKNFHRILFKPGVAVQARELNQLQTILQNQVSRFGNHVFKPGSMVIPGNTFFDKNFNYVKLEATYNSVDIDTANYLDRELIGQTSGIRAKVIKVEAATTTEPPTLFVKYLDSGTSRTATAFTTAEVIQTNDTGTVYYATVGATAPTGKCIGVSINTGVYFIRDAFVRVAADTLILDKYLSNSSYKVGLEVTESTVNSDDDETLLDPAIGTYNYFAPGADRYKIALTLAKRDINDASSADSFIELVRVKDGELVDIVTKPGYNVLADELARRTYDESGDYTVNPFNLKFIEHLKDTTNTDGYLITGDGGDSTKAIAVLSPGKSYVKGYEVATTSNRYLVFNKPRDTANVTNAIVRTPIGNYVSVSNAYSIPNFTSDLITVNLYNKYTATKGSAAGTLVGNARIRGVETTTSNVMSNASTFSTFLFDVKMRSGYTFDRDVKQLYHAAVSDTGYVSAAFTGDIVATDVVTSGSVNLTNGSNSVVGVNTLFTTDLKAGDYVQFTSDTSNSYLVDNVISNTAFYIGRTYPLANVSGANFTRDAATIVDSDKATYLFPFPNTTIKDLADITVRTRRALYGTLSAGVVTFSTAVGTTFASRSDTNYYAVGVSGGAAGKLYAITSGKFAFTDAPTNRNISIDLSGYGLTTEDVIVYATVIKASPTAKTKTSTSGQTSYTAATDCQAPVISLGYADAYAIANVKMSSNVFGTAYSDGNAVDVTSNYTLDTNQTPTYYGVSRIKLKPGAPAPTGPIQINFTYYAHGAGDYFCATSYPDYEDIPKFTDQGIVYDLRDCLDFRPRISNAATNFKDTGASRNEFLDYTNDFQTDYEYYLPRTDKIFLTTDKEIVYKEGVSSLTPAEPSTPVDAMPLYVIEHPAYGFDINRDSTFTSVDQKRYTMKDIGKLENRIKNLEYYTTLSLLELDTAVFSVKDSFGLDRYKNGFIVDSFRGHGVGDIRNSDYNISMDFEEGKLKPAYYQKNIKVSEVNTSDAQRTANGYVLVNNNTVMLEYTDEEYINVNVASGTESITPFDNFTFTGKMTLAPSGDTWFDDTTKPLVYKDDNGTYDTLIPDSVGEKTYGTVWNSWKQFWFSSDNKDKVKAIEGGAVVTDAGVTGDSTSVVFPYVRANSIAFNASRLKPNTHYYAFFDEYNVTNYCTSGNTTSNVFGFDANTTNFANIITDYTGTVNGVFNFDPVTSGLKVPSGKVTFRLTDSSTNSSNKESFADAFFVSNGTLIQAIPPRINYTADAPLSSGSALSTASPGLVAHAVAFITGNKDPNSITAEQAAAYEKYFKTTGGAGVAFNEALFQSLAPSGTNIYNVRSLITSNSYNFVSGNGTNATTSTGTDLNSYLTATNILEATNTVTGKTFVQEAYDRIQADLGYNAIAQVVEPVYQGVRGVAADVVAKSAGNYDSLPKDMKDFWEAGLANGSFTESAEGVAKALDNYAAAITVGYLDRSSSSSQAAASAAASNGLV
ncbi:Domain of unknown function DUF4815 [uncultured Caudovirales phage]|uniref:DUF4815 domain-containing protein n=1 Tax=uncultured Caudovirales phage TaxID=2100421 RepID=A0A6J7X3S3_9CAUD|nr:Domain of unknown function DUF4815 [uncultured Caudovirales phage]